MGLNLHLGQPLARNHRRKKHDGLLLRGTQFKLLLQLAEIPGVWRHLPHGEIKLHKILLRSNAEPSVRIPHQLLPTLAELAPLDEADCFDAFLRNILDHNRETCTLIKIGGQPLPQSCRIQCRAPDKLHLFLRLIKAARLVKPIQALVCARLCIPPCVNTEIDIANRRQCKIPGAKRFFRLPMPCVQHRIPRYGPATTCVEGVVDERIFLFIEE